MILSLALACSEYRIAGEPEPPTPDIRVTVAPMDAKVCADTPVAIDVANVGTATLSVSEFSTDNALWTLADATPFDVAPGGHATLAVIGSGGASTLRLASNDPDTPVSAVLIESVGNVPPTALVLSPYDEQTLPSEGDVTLTAIVGDDDDSLGALSLEWVSSLSGSIAHAIPDGEGFVRTLWPAADRGAGPQTVSLLVADACDVPVEDYAWFCQDGPFVIYPILDEGWRFDGPASLADDILTLTDGTLDVAGSVFDLGSIFDGDDAEIAFEFQIEGTGGEGLSVTLLDAGRREGYVGGDGCGLGFGGGAACTSGPALPGWSLAIDTHTDDIDCDAGTHVAFTFDGNVSSPAACAAIPAVEDGAWHTLHIRLVDAHLAVELDGAPVLDTPLVGITSFQGVVGFTASTADTVVSHRIRNVAVTAVFPRDVEPARKRRLAGVDAGIAAGVGGRVGGGVAAGVGGGVAAGVGRGVGGRRPFRLLRRGARQTGEEQRNGHGLGACRAQIVARNRGRGRGRGGDRHRHRGARIVARGWPPWRAGSARAPIAGSSRPGGGALAPTRQGGHMSDSSVVFPHHRLDAYNVALELAVAVRALVERMPRGHGSLTDQMSRASISTVTNIAEGANRLGTGEKRQKFSIARGEVGECAACIELAARLGLVPGPDAAAALVLAGRVAAMLTRLIQRFGG